MNMNYHYLIGANVPLCRLVKTLRDQVPILYNVHAHLTYLIVILINYYGFLIE